MSTQSVSLFNKSHLDHLSENVEHDGETLRIVHIYAEAPDYQPQADPIEGTACVDDATRSALVYLRHFQLTGDQDSLTKAEATLRFVLYMQADDGRFYNFVLNNQLEINRAHHRSLAETFAFWTARAAWALGAGADVLAEINPSLADACADALEALLPHIRVMLDHYPHTLEYRGRMLPTWLVQGDGADATSEMLLGLVAYNRARPSMEIQSIIARLAEGITLMRYGSMNEFPFGLHASNRDNWHLWGNSQTQALAEAGIVTSATLEADHFYSRLLVEGYLHSISFDDLHAIRYYERIAYGVRAVAVGLLRLYDATQDLKYAIMSGLAAAWFTGNNIAGEPMYDPETGRGFDGLDSNEQVNHNSGAESTLEALFTMLEIEQQPMALRWLHARGQAPKRWRDGDDDCFGRLFVCSQTGEEVAVVMNLTHETVSVQESPDIPQLRGA